MFFCTSSLWWKIMFSNKVQFFNPLTLLGPTKCGQRRWLFWHGVGSKSAGRSCQELLGSCRESREVLCCQGSLGRSWKIFPVTFNNEAPNEYENQGCGQKQLDSSDWVETLETLEMVRWRNGEMQFLQRKKARKSKSHRGQKGLGAPLWIRPGRVDLPRGNLPASVWTRVSEWYPSPGWRWHLGGGMGSGPTEDPCGVLLWSFSLKSPTCRCFYVDTWD